MQLPKIVQRNISLKQYCTLRIGGIADYFAEPSNETELIELISFTKAIDIPFLVIGWGSNVLFDDEGFRGLIIRMSNKYSSVSITGSTITAQAGAWMPHVARLSQVYGLTGLEHTIGIPGTIGGMVVMNGGSLRKTISENILGIKVMLPTGEIKTIKVADCKFGYRQSIFQEGSLIVLEAIIKCDEGDKTAIRSEMLNILRSRRRKFPRKQPNCGSVFVSDPNYYEKLGPPGKIIEDLGLKGKSHGGIYISKQHANFFLNSGNGTAKDFLWLVEDVKRLALKVDGIMMKTEVRYIPQYIHPNK